MGELAGLVENAKLEKLLGLLVYGPHSNRDVLENYDKVLQEKYQETFTKISSIYSGNFGQDEDMRSAIYQLTDVRDDIYFEAGALFGFRLFKEMEDGFARHKEEILSMLENKGNGDGRNRKEDAPPGRQGLLEATMLVEKLAEILKNAT